MRASPLWPVRLAVAPTIPRECRVEEEWVLRDQVSSTQFSAAHTDAGRLPRARLRSPRSPSVWPQRFPMSGIHVLEGHGHFAHKADPAMVTAVIKEFVAT